MWVSWPRNGQELFHVPHKVIITTFFHSFTKNVFDIFAGLCVQALYVFMALSLARDEFLWLLRHHDNPPRAVPKKAAPKMEELIERGVRDIRRLEEQLRMEPTTGAKTLELQYTMKIKSDRCI